MIGGTREGSVTQLVFPGDDTLDCANRLHAIFDALPMAVALLSDTGTVVAVNRAWEESARRGGFIGHDCAPGEDYRLACAASPIAEGPLIADAVADLLDGSGEGATILYRQGRANAPGHHHFHCAVTPTHQGDKRGVLVMHTDVTVETSARLALQEREAHFRSILDTVPDAMIVIDEMGIVHSFSAAAERLFGYGSAEIVGNSVDLLMPPTGDGNHVAYLSRYRQTGRTQVVGASRLLSGRRRNGEIFPMELWVGEVHRDGHTLFTGFAHDLTQRQRTEARLQELQDELLHVSRLSAMGQMAAALAHELNQPLTAVVNYLEGGRCLLDMDAPNLDSLRRAMELGAEQALRAGQIIRRLRDFLGRGESDTRVENIARIIDEASALALVGARSRGVSVSTNIDRSQAYVLADGIQIQQVLLNLIRNAIEAMEGCRNRTLVIATAGRGAEIEFSVTDSGPGIPPDIAHRLFQPFVTSKSHGMGIGLSTCRTIVEGHGGRLWAETVPEGGTSFRFTLPAPPQDRANG
jgi:two-component system sensor kinase FixL